MLYSNDKTLTTVSSYSGTESAGNAILEEIIVFQVLIENDDKTHTREDMYSKISEISYMIPKYWRFEPCTNIHHGNRQHRDRHISKTTYILFGPSSTKTMISQIALPEDTLYL